MATEKGGYIQRLILKGESQFLDFKFEINDSRKIARSLVAFANTDGGTLLIGVKDNGKIAGVRTEEEYYMLEAAAQLYCKPEIKYTAKKWEIGDKTVLEVIIPKSENKPHYASETNGKWMVYVRVNDENILANRIILKVWERKNTNYAVEIKYSRKHEFLLQYLEEKEQITLKDFMNLAELPKYVAENVLIDFILLDEIKVILTQSETYYALNTK